MSHEQLPLDRVASIAMAVGRGLCAFAETLGASAAVAPLASPRAAPAAPAAPPATPPASPPAPAPAPTTDPVTAELLAGIKAAMAPEPAPRKRRAIIPRRHRPEGPGCDYVDEDGTRFLNQRGVCERLRLRPQHIVQLEESGRLQRHFVEGRVAYRCEDVDALVEKMRAFERAQSQAVTDSNGACAVSD